MRNVAKLSQDIQNWNLSRAIGVTLLAIFATVGHFAPAGLGLQQSANGLISLVYGLWAVACWPVVISRPLQEYVALEKAGNAPRKKPFSYWFCNICATAMLTILVSGFVYSLLKTK